MRRDQAASVPVRGDRTASQQELQQRFDRRAAELYAVGALARAHNESERSKETEAEGEGGREGGRGRERARGEQRRGASEGDGERQTTLPLCSDDG